MQKQWSSITLLAKQTDIPYASCYNYIQGFMDFFKFKGKGKSKKFDYESSMKLLVRIRYLSDQGLDKQEISKVLEKEFPMTVDVEDDTTNEDTLDSTSLVTTDILYETINQAVSQAFDEQNKLIRELTKKLDAQQQYIENSIVTRDQNLIETIRLIQEQNRTKEQIASSKTSYGVFGWFFRLFKKM
ncbi:hypothetical protein U0X36_26035 [Bacillus thuringiensis]|uniref:hypothetical protein n=1 Tax=Bacillus thuringiensis TaxID=1428 RepID=UPI000E49E976|nr:hypothetical protein [Bacillus thuringiensis]MDZ3956275.1 hypothetical protein [Bacillus thuringiensis]RGP43008.1 hypothetical protein BTW32_30290 [Bacillus thuringiensis]